MWAGVRGHVVLRRGSEEKSFVLKPEELVEVAHVLAVVRGDTLFGRCVATVSIRPSKARPR